MRKIKLLLVILLCSLYVHAEGYEYMTFLTSDGTKQIAVTNLTMTISGTNLVADNGTTSLTLPLSTVQTMLFSDANGNYTDLNQTSFNPDGKVSVFNLEGKSFGLYESLNQAISSLSSGTYIIQQDANSFKIMVP